MIEENKLFNIQGAPKLVAQTNCMSFKCVHSQHSYRGDKQSINK